MNTTVLQGGALTQQLRRIDQLLVQSQHLWQAPAFSSRAINEMHQRTFSATPLFEAIRARDLESLEIIDADPHQLFALLAAPLDSIVPGYAAVHRDLEAFLLPPIDGLLESDVAVPFWLETGIGGRKLEQIKRFIHQVPTLRGDVLEWCAGKGHLGRLWQHIHSEQDGPPAHVHSLEWQADLCLQGTQLAAQHEVKQTFYHKDALQPLLWPKNVAPRHALALHACGDLHRALLHYGVDQDLRTLIIAPCCYHLTVDAMYRPLSQSLTGYSELRLPKSALKLAVQGQVTGGRRITKLRHIEVQWRLAYQIAREFARECAGEFASECSRECEPECESESAYEAEATGREQGDEQMYKPLPALPKALLSEDFDSFFKWACAQHDWQPNVQLDYDAWLTQAGDLHLKLKQLDLVRHSFRRLLELWLVLDRAVFLEEHGYEVNVKVFCPYTTSPRNLLIIAKKSSAQKTVAQKISTQKTSAQKEPAQKKCQPPQ